MSHDSSDRKVQSIRKTLHRVGNVTGSGALAISAGLHSSDLNEWRKVVDQRNAWEEWASEQRRWSEHKCYVNPTCSERTVRYYVAEINSIHDVLFLVGHKYRRTGDPTDLEVGRKLYWLLFERYAKLSEYLEFGDDSIKKWMKARGMEVL